MRWMEIKTRKQLDMAHILILCVGVLIALLTWLVYAFSGVEPYQIAKLAGGVGIQVLLAVIFMELRYGRNVKC